MRVVINALSARRGGGQTYLINLLQHLDSSPGLEVVLLSARGWEVPSTPRLTRLPSMDALENPLVRTAWERAMLPRLLADLRPQVLFCPGGLVNTRAPAGCRTVTMFRNMIPFDLEQRRKYPLWSLQRPRNLLLHGAMLRSMIEADLVIFISEFARKTIDGVSEGRVRRSVVIPHGLSENFRTQGRAVPPRPAWLPEGPYLLYVSLFDVYKNQLEVVRAYARLRELRRTPERLVLAGQHDTRYGQRVRAEIDRLGLREEVVLTGNVPYGDLPALYAHAVANLFASESENCPNILLEALGAGRPLFASDRAPMPEFGSDAAVYFDPTSPEDLATKLANVLDDPEVLGRLGERAGARAGAYDWRTTAERTWKAIEALVAGEGEGA